MKINVFQFVIMSAKNKNVGYKYRKSCKNLKQENVFISCGLNGLR